MALKDVARREGISEKYLWQVANPLKTAGLIRAVPGARGGYALARSPAVITLRDILAALEGESALVTCVVEPESCARAGACATREVWARLDAKIADVLGSFSLEDMVERQRALGAGAPEYSI